MYLYILLFLLLENYKFQAGLYVFFDKKSNVKKNIIILIILNVLCPFFFSLSYYKIRLLMYLLNFLLFIFIQKENFFLRIRNMIFLCFLLSCCDETFERILALLNILCCNLTLNYDISYLMGSICTIIIISIALCLKRRNPNIIIDKINIWLDKYMQFCIICMAIAMLITISLLNFTKLYIHFYKYQIFVNVICIISFIGVGVLCSFFVYLNYQYKKNNVLLNKVKILNDLQKSYYCKLLKKEENTKKFRHDISNHLICLNMLTIQNNNKAILDYLNHLQSNLNKVNMSKYNSGNSIIDAINSYYLDEISDSVIVDLDIDLLQDKMNRVDDISLCTIYSNLLKNSIEEVKRIENNKPKYIKINIKRGKFYLQFNISNSLSESSKKKKLWLYHTMTMKKDKEFHGYGLKNVKETVKQLEGQYKMEIDNDMFCTSVFLKL